MDSSSWRPINISSLNSEEIIGLEELTDYTEIKDDILSSKSKTIKKSHHKKKKLKNIINVLKEFADATNKCLVLSPARMKQLKKYCNKKLTNGDILPASSIDKSKIIDMSSWSIYNLHPSILSAIQTLGFEAPTEIQSLVLPHAIKTRNDILGAAETGSGKTLAFGIPMVNGILYEDKEENQLFGMILTPTRELAVQVRNHLVNLCTYTNIKVAVIIGGMSSQKQTRILSKCPEIIVATPGRLYELVKESNPYLQNLDNIRYLVLDEADRMLEKGHFEDLRCLLDIINRDPDSCKRRQTMVFSATLSYEHDVPQRVKQNKSVQTGQYEKLKHIIELVGMKSRPKIVDITSRGATVPVKLEEAKINCSLTDKDYYLYYLLKMYPGRTLVFCNSIDCVRRLTSLFTFLKLDPYPIHASMHQKQRLKNLERFTLNSNGLLIATDVTARGLDIKGVEHVIHYQVPRVTENYIHRSGRTARAGQSGIAILLIEPGEVKSYLDICKSLNREKDLDDFPIQHNVLQTAKKVVNLAREIEILSYRNRKENVEVNWKRKAAADMEIELDTESSEDEATNYKKMDSNISLANKKKALEKLLKQPFLIPQYAGCYPTKSGNLEIPGLGTHNACLDLKAKENKMPIKTKLIKRKAIKRKKNKS